MYYYIIVNVLALKSYQARWVNTESTEQATTSVLIARNSSILSLKAIISVGHTKVLWSKKIIKIKSFIFNKKGYYKLAISTQHVLLAFLWFL